MKRKILILIGFVLVLCGCDAEVNLKVSKNDIEEIINITDYTGNYSSETMLVNSYRDYIPVFSTEVIVDTEPDTKKPNVEYYTKSKISFNNGYNFTYKYKYNFEDYYMATSVKSSYRSTFIQHDKKENNIIISTDSAGCLLFKQYKTLNSLKVNISSGYKVLESNADSINGDIHTWNLSRNNDKNIYIKYDTTMAYSSNSNDNNTNEEETNDEVIVEGEKDDAISPFYAILIIILSLIVFIIFVCFVIKIDKRKYE